MLSENFSAARTHRWFLISLFRTTLPLALLFLLASPLRLPAQIATAVLSGRVTDASGSPVAAATVTTHNVGTNVARSTETDAAGVYQLPALAVGEYQVTVTKDRFQTIVRGGIHLVVGQTAQLDFTLQVGAVSQQVTVTQDVPPVNNSTTDISGLVGEKQVKDLPLNGRSYDELMQLDPGVVNFTFEKAGGTGISNSTTANDFAVDGNRPQQNLFLLNGIEFTGAAENNMTPGGPSGELIGVDAVQEFNLLTDGYGAEYGKKPGGQVSILTQSGSNQFHGSAYEFVRNSALDARNFFDPAGAGPPPFSRNQFGVSAGGPIQKNKTFVFADYEGFRQNWDLTSAALVPNADARADASATVQDMGLLNLWPIAPPGDPNNFIVNPATGDGVAEVFGTAPQRVREDFGTLRIDHVFSSTDSLAGIYTVDDGASTVATPADPYSTDITTLREQVVSAQEIHSFSSELLNDVRVGFSRAGYFFTGEPTPGTPAATVSPFIDGVPFVGAVVVGGSQASNPQAEIGLAGSNNGSNLHISRNLVTFTDNVSLTKGIHHFRFGVWFQPFLSNENIALSQYGQLTFTGLSSFLSGTGTFLYDPVAAPQQWRSLFGAWYAEDVIRLGPSLNVSLGFRDEFTNGLNSPNGQAANYQYSSSGVIQCASMPASNICLPAVGTSVFTVNRAKFLPQPRLSLAWSPGGHKTVVHATFGMYDDLQDALGYRLDQNAPFDPVYNITPAANIATILPINPAVAPPSAALLAPGGVQPDMYTPTVIEYSAGVERQLSRNTSVSVRYVGNHGYHELVGADANAPKPVVCPASPCPADFPTTDFPGTTTPIYGALAGTAVPAGTLYSPAAQGSTAPKPNTHLGPTWTWFSEGDSEYNAMQAIFNWRAGYGLSLHGTYTLAKSMDDGDSLNSTTTNNEPGLISDPYNPHVDWGPSAFDVRNSASINAVYLLPFGRGQQFLSNSEGALNGLVSGWTLNSIVLVQSGLPFTPQLSYNPANNGDTKNPVRPFLNPGFTGSVVTGNPNQWFNSDAFIAPPSNSNFYGDMPRNAYRGPGLATWDFSVFKDTPIPVRSNENLTLEIRAEFFNLLNRANFNTPSLIVDVLQPAPNTTLPEPSGSAGVITSTATTSRQIQFGVKVLW